MNHPSAHGIAWTPAQKRYAELLDQVTPANKRELADWCAAQPGALADMAAGLRELAQIEEAAA